ncbi:TetR/AcrR family transcriptional regulator [Corynebacterium cystitidis]|uniref:TetR/AcrR family transcriptional regulator n=1 Tax=Corynebacterium cystitidis TaxID=35757 RepID=UPI00211E4A85|nr:TetR family transcriptional regulator [Corynebacterium cystitidis]
MPSPSEATKRERIIEAAIMSLNRDGMEGTTLRRVADIAGVSLGAITHHFNDRETLLVEAMACYATSTLESYESFFADATDLESARRSVVKLLTAPADARFSAGVGSELYSISLRRPRYRLILDKWTRASREIIGRYFDEETTYVLDALYEGMLLHRRMKLGQYPDELVYKAVTRLTPPHTYIGPGSSR